MKKKMPASPIQQARKEFQAKLMPFGMALFNKAEAYGIDWRGMSIESLIGAVYLAEEYAKTPEWHGIPEEEFIPD